jgi:transposase
VDLKAELFSYSIDEEKKRYLELLDGKLLLVTNTSATAAEVVQRYKSLADIERGFRVLKSDIEIGPVYHPTTANSRPCADLFHGTGAVPGDAHAPEGRQTL